MKSKFVQQIHIIDPDNGRRRLLEVRKLEDGSVVGIEPSIALPGVAVAEDCFVYRV